MCFGHGVRIFYTAVSVQDIHVAMRVKRLLQTVLGPENPRKSVGSSRAK